MPCLTRFEQLDTAVNFLSSSAKVVDNMVLFNIEGFYSQACNTEVFKTVFEDTEMHADKLNIKTINL